MSKLINGLFPKDFSNAEVVKKHNRRRKISKKKMGKT